MTGARRVIVGTSGSPGSLRALRYAEGLARVCDATLIPVLAWTPPGGDLAERGCPCAELRQVWQEDALRRLRDALSAACGGVPGDLRVDLCVERGEAGPVLVDAACRPDDLLVVGTGRRGVLARVVAGRVSRYCLTHACCPVLAVPPPDLARELGHGLLRWAFWQQPLTPERILRDRGHATT